VRIAERKRILKALQSTKIAAGGRW